MGRQRRTDSQSGLSATAAAHLRGAFFVAEPERIAGRSILLLDDIYTTGATARECTQTLLRAAAKSVYVATLARSQREGVVLWILRRPECCRNRRSKDRNRSFKFCVSRTLCKPNFV